MQNQETYYGKNLKHERNEKDLLMFALESLRRAINFLQDLETDQGTHILFFIYYASDGGAFTDCKLRSKLCRYEMKGLYLYWYFKLCLKLN